MGETRKTPPLDSRLFREVFNALPIGIAVENLERQPLFVNPALCSMLGFTAEELCSKHCVDFSSREDAQEDRKLFQKLKAGLIEHYQLEKRYFRRDGSFLWGRLHLSWLNSRVSPLVIAMVEDVTQRKLGEEALRASEERLRITQSAARMGAFEWNIRTGANTWTPELEAMHGLPPGGFAGTQTAFETLLHPDDRRGVIELVASAMKTGQPTKGEWRVIWPDGSVHWMVGRFQVFMNESGEPSRMVGVNIDISERKQAEQALAEMTRNLIQAQEQERARIGRELHDDINQRLAMLAVELEQLQEIAPDARRRIQELRKKTTEISNDVQALSHDLHSSKLEYLGVVAGIRSWCREFSERQKMQIHFKSAVHSLLPLEVGISLFRILQEALHNVIKHSGAKWVEVQLREDYGEIHLMVSDSGKGFDVESATKRKGLGLTSMRERVRLLGGTIAIDSKTTVGTTIRVRVPLKLEPDAQVLAG